MADYPDYTRLFYLVGSSITLDINIAGADVTLPISIDAATITLDINLAASAIDLNIVFTDQSVAVFDAAQWFAHQAAQVYVYGAASVDTASTTLVVSRTVPSGKTFYITYISWALNLDTSTNTICWVDIAGSSVVVRGEIVGSALIFNTPVRATTGQLVEVQIRHHAGSTGSVYATIGGYDEDN